MKLFQSKLFWLLVLVVSLSLLFAVVVSAQDVTDEPAPTLEATVAPVVTDVPPVEQPPVVVDPDALTPRDAAFLLVLGLAFVVVGLFGSLAIRYVGNLAPRWAIEAGFQAGGSVLTSAGELATITPNTIDDELVKELTAALNKLHDRLSPPNTSSRL